jgi:uroporphyrinogen-III synthase
MIYLLSPLIKDETISLPMIKFELLANEIDFGESNLLMFTSKQAVVSADKIDSRWKEYDTIAIGGATKKKIEELGGRVLYHPKEFYGEVLAQDIKSFFANKRILYLRPEEISFDSKGFLAKEGIDLAEQVLYRTSCCTYPLEAKPKEGATIIFTSPSTIRCFFRNFTWDESYTAVLIGKATKAHLPKECRYVVAQRPLIDSCIKKAKEIYKNSDI